MFNSKIQKRPLDSNENINNYVKKVRIVYENKMKYNFDDLPNEIYHDIFDYLSLLNIIHSFSGINLRLNHLIDHIPMKLNFQNLNKTQSKRIMKQILPNRIEQIISLDMNQNFEIFINPFNQSFCLTQFINLRHLSFPSNDLQQLKSLFSILPNLYSLRSLRLIEQSDSNLHNETVCKLTLANNNQYLINKSQHLTHISIETSPPFKNLCLLQTSLTNKIFVNYLQINIRCALFFYPQSLKYIDYHGLSCLTSDMNYLKLNLYFGTYRTVFDLIQYFPKIQYLSVKTNSQTYANGYHWADLLAQMSNLTQINFNIYLDSEKSDQEFDTFQTKFWLDKQWMIKYERKLVNSFPCQIIHRSIQIR